MSTVSNEGVGPVRLRGFDRSGNGENFETEVECVIHRDQRPASASRFDDDHGPR
jgi:hypothetical protein